MKEADLDIPDSVNFESCIRYLSHVPSQIHGVLVSSSILFDSVAVKLHMWKHHEQIRSVSIG